MILRNILSIIVPLLATATVSAAQPSVLLKAVPNKDNSMSIMADIKGCGTFTIEILFADLANTKSPERVVVKATESGELVRLQPQDKSKQVWASPMYNWVQGDLDPQYNEDFVYGLPFGSGTGSTPRSVSPREAGLERANISEFTMWQFPLGKGDKVCAARDGLVIRTEVTATDNGAFSALLSVANRVVIEHADGTHGEYSFLSAGSLAVAEGDRIKAGAPIAGPGADNEGEYGVRFAVYYYASNTDARRQSLSTKRYLNPTFATIAGETKLAEGTAVESIKVQAVEEEPAVAKTVKTKEKAGKNKEKANRKDSKGEGKSGNFFQRIFGKKDRSEK